MFLSSSSVIIVYIYIYIEREKERYRYAYVYTYIHNMYTHTHYTLHEAHKRISIFLQSRLCIVEPSICKLRLLAFAHSLYHALKNDPRGVKANGFPVSPNSMQILASVISRSIKYTILGGTA